MILIDKNKLQQARVAMDAHRFSLSEDSQTALQLEFLSDLCRKIYFEVADHGYVILQQEGGENGINKGGEAGPSSASST